MASQAGNNVGFNAGWSIGEDGWKAGMDRNFVLAELLTQPNVFSRALTAPPGAPAHGDRYLIPPTGSTGDWASPHGNKLAIRDEITAEWVKIAPLAGWRVYVADEALWLQYSGTAWVVWDSAGSAAADVGDGAALTYDIVHNLGTRDVLVQCYRNSTPWDDVVPDVQRLDVNTVRLIFATIPSAAEYRVVIQA